MVTSRSARFRELSTSLDAECRRLGVPLRPGAAEELLAERVKDVASSLNIQEASALRTYFSDDWAATVAASIAQTAGESHEARRGQPVVMPSIVAAQLVSALGVAAKFAAVNAEHADANECTRIGADAGDALTVLGAALREGVEDPRYEAGMPVVSVTREATHLARDSMSAFAAHLADGSWRDCWCGQDELGHVNMPQLQRQVETDLSLVVSLLELARPGESSL